LDSANDGSNGAAEVSALVIPAKGELKALRPPDGGLMHSYHIVAKLRQFRGVFCWAPRPEGGNLRDPSRENP
jgi:hypothetical protein